MARTILSNQDADELTICSGFRLCYSILHNGVNKLGNGDVVRQIIPLATRLLLDAPITTKTSTMALGTLASCVFNDPLVSIQVLSSTPGLLEAVFTNWVQAISNTAQSDPEQSSDPDNGPVTLNTILDKKLSVLALSSIMALAFGTPVNGSGSNMTQKVDLPEVLKSNLVPLIGHTGNLLKLLIEQEQQADQQKDDEPSGLTDTFAQQQQLVDAGGYLDDQDADDDLGGGVEDAEFAALLSRLQQEANDANDFMYDFDEDDDEYSSALDNVSSLDVFLNIVQKGAAKEPQAFQSLGPDFENLCKEFSAFQQQQQQ